MQINRDNTQSFEYRRNECCHLILDKLYRRVSPIMREGTFGNAMKGIEGKVTSNSLFAWVDTSELVTELNEPDHFILDCGEYLWRKNHVDVLRKNVDPDIKDSGIIYQIMFTKQGLDIFKTDYYLKENQKQDLAKELHSSTINTNTRTVWIAALTLTVAAITFLRELMQHRQQQVTEQQFQRTLQSIDSSRQVQTNALYLLLTKFQKDVSYTNDTAQQKDTTR